MDLYYITISPPCWTVQLLGRQLEMPFNLKEIDYEGGEHLKEDFLKMNPAHTVPTLAVGNDFSIGESRAIMIYMMEKYAAEKGEHPLYPKDPKARGLIHSRLDFDLGTLYSRFYTYCEPLWEKDAQGGTEQNRKKLNEAFQILETFLSKTSYVASDKLTIADISLVASVSALDCCSFDRSQYVKVAAWYETCKKELVGYGDVVEKMFPVFKSFLIKPEEK